MKKSFIFFLIVISLTACKSRDVLKTPDGIPRKVIVRQDDTDLFDANNLKNQLRKTHQWDVWYIFEEGDDYYMIAGDLREYPETPLYVHQSDVFEWNTFFCADYKNSPHETGRDPIPIYYTLEGAQIADEDDIYLIEKEEHRTTFSPDDANLVLREHEGEIYYVAALYDNVDDEGNFVFLGNYAFGYQPYVPEALRFHRYVSKQQFAEQLRLLLGITGKADSNAKPSRVRELYGPIISLFAEWDDLDKGLGEIESIFTSPDMPQGAIEGLAPDQFIDNIESLDPKIAAIVDKMLDYMENPKNWDENGHAYVPVEWMEP